MFWQIWGPKTRKHGPCLARVDQCRPKRKSVSMLAQKLKAIHSASYVGFRWLLMWAFAGFRLQQTTNNSSKQQATTNEQQATNNQQPTTNNNQQPTTHNKQQRINNKQQTTHNQQQTTNKTTNNKQPTTKSSPRVSLLQFVSSCVRTGG